MVGLVIVSHSKTLAKSIVDLIHQISQEDIPIATAGGVGPNHEEFGTDAIEILESINRVYSSDGVLVLMDLGSAVLSAKTALEFMEPEKQPAIHLCAAPLVEGAIGAAVQIGLGSDIHAVIREAMQSLLPKKEQLEEGEETLTETGRDETALSDATKQELTLKVSNPHGLHARPAARFVRTASAFDARVQVTNKTTGKGPVTARSLNAIATLGVLCGHEILVSAEGAQAKEALDALRDLAAENFGDTQSPQADTIAPRRTSVKTAGSAIACTPIAEGIVWGDLAQFHMPVPPVPQTKIGDPAKAWNEFQTALQHAGEEIRKRRAEIAASAGESQAGIFDAHLLILQDPELLESTRKLVFDEKYNPAFAWQTCIDKVVSSYEALDDPYLKQRAADVRDVGNQVLLALSGKIQQRIVFEKPVILAAVDLTPTQTALLDLENIRGLITVAGGPTSHTAILARSLGIPALAGIPPSVLTLPEGTRVAIDGASGLLWLSPDDKTLSGLKRKQSAWMKERRQLAQSSTQPAATKDGHSVEVVANVGNLQDAVLAAENGAEGIGLLRTEFLFLTRSTPPDEEEQFTALRQIAEATGKNRRIIIRTLDVGGDKALPYLDLPREDNPFLGVRAVRLSLRHPDFFITQLRAILRAGLGYNFHVMFPMIANLDEFRRAKAMLEKAHRALEADGIAHAYPVKTGIMVEIPSAALLAPVFAPHVDFFSIGTNDLTQYTLAAERGNPNLREMADALHPAVLRLIGNVTGAAQAAGKWAGVCGELAGDPLAAAVLIGLGIEELSLNPAGIPKIKATLRKFTRQQAQSLASEVLAANSAEQARNIAGAFYRSLHA